MTIKPFIIASALALSGAGASADIVAHFPMTVKDGCVEETVSGSFFEVEGNFKPENLPGAVGDALRFDGYTSFVNASLGNILPGEQTKMTISVWVALPCYPIIKLDTQTTEKTAIASCLEEETRTGFGFFLGFDGKWSFKTFVGGWPVEITVEKPMPVYQWNCLTAVVDTEIRSVKLYNNGEEVGTSRCNGKINMTLGDFMIGHGKLENKMGPFLLTSFNGLIDDITIWNEALSPETIQGWKAENPANLDIPASRFEDDILRPRFHGMPAAAWTNECHGMWFSDGRYHLFFQKNADGPYMARLHWGHISSENLYDWQEEKIALAPGEWYDIKGCWSGCIFSDEEITGGEPNILYTAVDYAKAMIAQATPDDNGLVNWTKKSANPIIAGRPTGLSDDFRDPYFFRKGDDAYVIVGSSKDGVGTTTLHKYNPVARTWSNNGDLFFTGRNASADGDFWEMPNVTPMSGGKWLFTATPLKTLQGTRTLYWTGTIGDDGKFVPDARFSNPGQVELISRHGFGMLSPTIYQHDGKTIALGIVPDKLSAQDNWKLGWAHCYSLPREWSLDNNGVLIQKPFEGLTGLRTSTAFSRRAFTLGESLPLNPVEGRELEISGVFTVGTNPFGYRFFKDGDTAAILTYNPSLGELTMDFTSLPRLVNDGGVYDGVYRCALPEKPGTGEPIKINVFIDHSIVDVFINDRWATSVRVFPTEEEAVGVEAFADNDGVEVKELKAWTLSKEGGDSAVESIFQDSGISNGMTNVYHVSGTVIKANVSVSEALDGLSPGIYILGGKKIVVK